MKARNKLSQHPNLFAAFGLDVFTTPVETAEPDAPKLSAREEHRGRVMIETMLRCFSNPTIYCNHPTSAVPPPLDWLKKQRGMIELERAARLMKLLKRKPDASLDEIRACAMTLTNPEKCGVLSVISGIVPPGHEQAAEYLRAFAHCVEFEQFVELFGNMPYDAIPLADVERFYQLYGGQGNWGWLDDEERAWIRDFNKKVKEARKKKTAQ
jgi:hypothetical protein